MAMVAEREMPAQQLTRTLLVTSSWARAASADQVTHHTKLS